MRAPSDTIAVLRLAFPAFSAGQFPCVPSYDEHHQPLANRSSVHPAHYCPLYFDRGLLWMETWALQFAEPGATCTDEIGQAYTRQETQRRPHPVVKIETLWRVHTLLEQHHPEFSFVPRFPIYLSTLAQ